MGGAGCKLHLRADPPGRGTAGTLGQNRTRRGSSLPCGSESASARLQVGCRPTHNHHWAPPGDSRDTRAWGALRKLPEASYAGLALPRFLLRLPYGKETDPAELFDFEEMPQSTAHEDYLWGNPAFVCAALLAQAFSKEGWRMRPGTIRQIDGLPLHAYQENGECLLEALRRGLAYRKRYGEDSRPRCDAARHTQWARCRASDQISIASLPTPSPRRAMGLSAPASPLEPDRAGRAAILSHLLTNS